MKKQDREESTTQGSEDAPPTAAGMESPAAAKDSSDSNSLKESEPQTPQSDTPPQDTEAGSEGKVFPKHFMINNVADITVSGFLVRFLHTVRFQQSYVFTVSHIV